MIIRQFHKVYSIWVKFKRVEIIVVMRFKPLSF